MSCNIIGDIAGQFDCLQRLLAQMPAGTPISVGDMIDRGPKSVEVVEFFRKNGRAVMGNHEHMFLNYIFTNEKADSCYPLGCYLRNGGTNTIVQFDWDSENGLSVPVKFLDYIRDLRQQIVIMEPSNQGHEGLIITHAPIHPDPTSRQLQDYDRLWNRHERVEKRGNFYQVFGHNSHWDQRTFSGDTGEYARCLDTNKPKLVGMHWPTMEIFEEEF